MKHRAVLAVIITACLVALAAGTTRTAKACVGVCSSDSLQDIMRQTILMAQTGDPNIQGGDGATLLPGPTGGDLVPGVLDPTGGDTVIKPDPTPGHPVSGDGAGNPDGIYITPDGRIGIIPPTEPDGGVIVPSGTDGVAGPPDDFDTSHPYTAGLFHWQDGATKKAFNGNGLSFNVASGVRLAAGDLAVLVTVDDNSPPSTVTDSEGNLWRRAAYTPSTQGRIAIFASKLAHDLNAGDQINIGVSSDWNSYWSWSLFEIAGVPIKFPVGVNGPCGGSGGLYTCEGAGGGNRLQGTALAYGVSTPNAGDLLLSAAFSTSSGSTQHFLGQPGWLTVADVPFSPEPYEGRRYLGVTATILRGTVANVAPQFSLDRNTAGVSAAFKIGYWG